jgi:hypothetical protein
VNLPAGLVAWEDETVPFPANMGLTWWECLVSPDRFFRRVSWEGARSRPVLYFLLVAVLAAILGLFWFVWGPREAAAGLGLPLELQLLSFFLTPFVVLLALGLVSLVQHLFVLLLAPDRRGIGATVTVLCYGSGVGMVTACLPPAMSFAWPVTGLLGATYLVFYFTALMAVQAWYIVVLVVGLRNAHSTTTGQAAAIVLLPMAIGLVLTLILVVSTVLLLALSELPV